MWPQLPEADKELIAGLLRWRPVEVANRTVFGELLGLLLPDRIPDFRALGDGTVLVETGRHPREVARDCAQQLWLEQQARPERPVPVANSGQFAAWVRGGTPDARSARATYSLDVVPKTEPEAPIDLGPAAQADTIEVPVADLAALAARADDAFGERHRSDSVHRDLLPHPGRGRQSGPVTRGPCAPDPRGCSTRRPASGRTSQRSCWPAGPPNAAW